MRFRVELNIDGEHDHEDVQADDAQKAIKAALKLHPVTAESVTPLEEQLSIQPEDHEGQTAIPDPQMEAIGDAIAAESGGDDWPVDEGYQGQGDNLDVEPPVAAVSSEDLDAEGGVWEDIGTSDEAA